MLDDSSGSSERTAARVAVDTSPRGPGSLSRTIAGLDRATSPAPGSVASTLAEPGRPLDGATRSEAERRFGQDFSAIRLHTGAVADRSTADVDALAYTVGDHVALGAGVDTATLQGRRVLAHELAHVVQGGSPDVVRRYRRAGSMAFGELDTGALIEDSFKAGTDKETKPWISLVTVEFTSSTTDADGNTFWTGTATATYYGNPSKLPDVTFTVTGGSRELGRTDPGSFTVKRIEGYGYNSGKHSGTVDWTTRESGRNWKYTKQDAAGDRSANMSLAVFYHGGEALHVGPLDLSSHGCVHVDWTPMLQVNYHSVVGLTKVKVKYPARP